MDAAKEILQLLADLLLRYGLIGLLIIVVVLIVHEPDRAVKLKAIIFEPIFRLTRLGSKQYIGARVSSQVTEFLRKNLIEKLSNQSPITVKVKWVTSPADPVLKRDGTVILRMRETPDQTRNVLNATQLVLPFTVCPFLRPSLDQSVRTAIDLTILSKLASKLGSHAKATFQRYFLTPETESDTEAAELFTQLLELDSSGLFVSVFLEELNGMGDVAYSAADFVDRSNDVRSLLRFLLGVARKEVGKQVELDYHTPLLHIGVILVAKSSVASEQGVAPYMSRLRRTLSEGCNAVYLLAYSHKESFLPRVLTAIEGEDRVTIEKETIITIKENGAVIDHAKIVKLQRNTIYSDDIFAERVRLADIKVGDMVEGMVTDVSQEQAMVTVKGINSRISRENSSWQTLASCGEVLNVGDKCTFRITAIRKDRGELQLSLRQVSDDPWKVEQIPSRPQAFCF